MAEPEVIVTLGMEALGYAEDYSSVQIKLAMPPEESAAPREVYVQLPTVILAALTEVLAQQVLMLRERGVLPQQPPGSAKAVTSWEVIPSQAAQLAHHLLLGFDRGTPDAAAFVLKHFDALKIADAIQVTVFNGLSEVDKKKLLEDVDTAMGRKRGIILPGRR